MTKARLHLIVKRRRSNRTVLARTCFGLVKTLGLTCARCVALRLYLGVCVCFLLWCTTGRAAIPQAGHRAQSSTYLSCRCHAVVAPATGNLCRLAKIKQSAGVHHKRNLSAGMTAAALVIHLAAKAFALRNWPLDPYTCTSFVYADVPPLVVHTLYFHPRNSPSPTLVCTPSFDRHDPRISAQYAGTTPGLTKAFTRFTTYHRIYTSAFQYTQVSCIYTGNTRPRPIPISRAHKTSKRQKERKGPRPD